MTRRQSTLPQSRVTRYQLACELPATREPKLGSDAQLKPAQGHGGGSVVALRWSRLIESPAPLIVGRRKREGLIVGTPKRERQLKRPYCAKR